MRRLVVALVVAAGLAGSAAAVLAVPVLAACGYGTCVAPGPGGTTTVTAVDSIPGVPPQVGPHTTSGTGWTSTAAAAPACPPAATYEPVGGGPSVYGWAFDGVDHLVHGSPPSPGGWSLAKYWVWAEYTRSMSATCQPGPWLFAGFVASPVTFPNPTASTPGVSPAVKALEAEVEKNLVGGSVMTAPPLNALVNLPTYSWVAGSSIPLSLVKSKTVSYTPPGVGGREEVLTVAVVLERIGVTWHWGDGQVSQLEEPGAMGTPYPAANISHTYHMVSLPAKPGAPSPYRTFNSQGQIPVTATQNLVVSAWAVWIDASGRHQRELGSFPLAIPVAPHWINVLQVEGVPFCPTSKSCA